MKIKFLFFFFLAMSATTNSQTLSGNYTIGGTNPNYATIASAITDLTTNGVSGPVTFNIRPGIYAGTSQITTIPGTSSVNTVTFQSETLNAEDVTLTRINLTNGASYVTIRNIKFNVSTLTAKTAISLGGISGGNNTISNCTFTGGQSISLDFFNANNVNKENNSFISIFSGNSKIMNCTFGNCGSAIYKSSTTYFENITISGNTFGSNMVCPIYGSNMGNITISGNIFTGAVAGNAIYAVSKGNNFITGNTIMFPDQNIDIITAISVTGVLGQVSNLTVSNNVISCKGRLSLPYMSTINLYHNSIRSANTNCITFGTSSNFVAINSYNNIFHSPYNQSNVSIINVNLASFHSNNNAFNKDYNAILYNSPADDIDVMHSLTDWKTISNKETNSPVAGTVYAPATNLETPNALQLNGSGTPIASLPVDINGISRSSTAPDIGAYEFNVDPAQVRDLEITNIVSPANMLCEDSDAVIAIKNNSYFVISNYNIECIINNFRGNILSYTTPINPGQTINVPVTNCEIRKNTHYEKIEFIVSEPNGNIDNNYGNSHKTVFNVLQLDDFTIRKSTADCELHTLYAPIIQGTTINWSTGEATQKITVPAGSYTATITDAQGCQKTATITIN